MNANVRAGLVVFSIIAISPSIKPQESRASPDRLGETFSEGGYDRRFWSIAQPPPGGQFDCNSNSLNFIIPPGGAGRPPASLRGLFRLEGNFALRVEFGLDRWPAPMAEWINLEIEIEGEDGHAAIIRTRHFEHGNGYVAWSQRKDPTSDGSWRQLPTSAASGSLRLVRKGAILSFWAADSGSEEQLLDITEFGTSRVDSVAFRVTVPATRGAVEARIDNITVEADRLIVEPRSLSPPTPRWDRASTTIALLLTLAAAGSCYLRASAALTPFVPIPLRASDSGPDGHRRSVLLASMACGIVSVGVYLRADGLDRKSMSGDEVASASRNGQSSLGRELDGNDNQRFPPIHDLVARGWIEIWGPGDPKIRGLSEIIGLLAIPAIDTVWGPLLGRWSKLWAVSLLSVSALHVLISQDARVDSAVWLLSAISCGSMLHLWLRSPRRWVWWWVYVFSSACLPMVSPSGVVPLAVQALYIAGWLFMGRSGWGRVLALALASAATLVASAVRLPYAADLSEYYAHVTRLIGPGRAEIPMIVLRMASALGTGSVPPARSNGLSSMEWAVVVAQIMSMAIAVWMAASTLIAALRRMPGEGGTGPSADVLPAVVAFLAAWCIAPVLTVLAVSSGAPPLGGAPWVLYGVAPGSLLGVAAGRPRAKMAPIVILLCANLVILLKDKHFDDREPWREIAIATGHAASAVDLSVPGIARDLIVAWPDESPFDEACLRHAIKGTSGSNMSLYFMPIREALKSGMPFVVVAIHGRPPPLGGPPYGAGLPPEGCSSRLIYSSGVLDGRSLPTLDLFNTRSVSVWACEVTPSQSRIDGP